jgi:prepilin-type processing-associated H-X9-DG protein
MPRLLVALSLGTLALAAVPAAARAQIGLAPQVSYGDDYDFAVGGRLALRLPTETALEITGSFDLFFPEADNLDYWEVNANVNYLVTMVESLFVPYVGAGLNVARLDGHVRPVENGFGGGEFSETEYGANLLVGVRYVGAAAVPFAEARFEVDGGDQVVFTAGVLFTIGPGP